MLNLYTDTIFCATDSCRDGGTCTELFFSLSCSCPAGFTGNRCEQTYKNVNIFLLINLSICFGCSKKTH